MRPEPCPSFEEALVLAAHDELGDPIRAAELEAHRERCGGCHSFAGELAAARALAEADAARIPGPPDRLHRPALEAVGESRPGWWSRLAPALAPALAAICLFASPGRDPARTEAIRWESPRLEAALEAAVRDVELARAELAPDEALAPEDDAGPWGSAEVEGALEDLGGSLDEITGELARL